RAARPRRSGADTRGRQLPSPDRLLDRHVRAPGQRLERHRRDHGPGLLRPGRLLRAGRLRGGHRDAASPRPLGARGAVRGRASAVVPRVTAIAIGAWHRAVSGALYVWNIGFIDPSAAFSGTVELQTILMVLIGGIGTVWGPVVGAIVVSVIGQLLWAQYPQQEQIILGALTILMVVLLPGGLVSLGLRFGVFQRRPVWAPSSPPRPDASPPVEREAAPNAVPSPSG